MISRRSKSGFTLVEMLVVVAIMALLVAMLMPSLNKARAQAKRVACQSQLRQLTVGLLMYADEHKGVMVTWGWQFEETVNGNGHPSEAARLDFIKRGKIYKYCPQQELYVCYENPVERLPGYHVNRKWGFPPYWSYVLNGQAARSLAHESREDNWCNRYVKPDRVRPSPSRVVLLMEQWPGDIAAFDNSITLVASTFTSGNDSLTDVHLGGGSLSFYDGHVEWVSRQDYITRQTVPAWTIDFFGGFDAPYRYRW